MNIGFDAKRAFHNHTGLGHYSRTLIRSLSEYHPEHQYYLFNPKPSSLFSLSAENIKEIQPAGLMNKLFRSAWRSNWVTKDLQKLNIDLYHGLSHEIPFGIEKEGIKSVVTIHDLIHERFPEQYSPLDIKIYTKKYKNACTHADKVIAISNQTRQDLIDYYKVPEEKIEVCYQSCNPAFAQQVSEDEKQRVRQQYNLPEQFFLSVGSIIERKNLLNVCKAVFLLRNELDVPLVVIGGGTKYKQQVKDYVKQNGLDNRIIFLSDDTSAKSSKAFQSAIDFPAVYQSSLAMIYPSFFEGFGIPILEALWSKVPVITSNVSCLPEAGGDAAYYVNPNSAEEIAKGMKKVYSDNDFADDMRKKGWQHAQNFTQQKCADAVMNVYKKIW
jgi:glycosyltransferase involved in cell wall biosynthesis